MSRSPDQKLRPLTPDFYSYNWEPLQQVDLQDDFVSLTWPDGQRLRCYALWLAENTLGLEPLTREGMMDPANLPEASQLIRAYTDPDGALRLAWAEGVETRVHPGWLKHVARRQFLPSSWLPSPIPWDASLLQEPPSHDGTDILGRPEKLRHWLQDLCSYGMARLTNTPADTGFTRQLAGAIGPIRSSNFGDLFEVKSVLEPDSTAYTGLNLGQHADLPSRETPPGFQFLHCIENSVSGGWSRLTDGLSLVAELREKHAGDFEALTTLNWVFNNRAKNEDHRWVGPIIDHEDDGYPLTLRAFYPVRGFPAMDEKDIPRAYAALRRFSLLAHDPRFQVRYPFRAGDLVGFDNRRVLHGRDAFDPGEGMRHLSGFYIDQDDVYSRLRVLNRRHEQEQRQ